MIPIVSFVGKSGIGKTTFVEKVVRELAARGVRVAVIKHHAHETPIDAPGKDSWRYAEAGADTVVVSSPREVAQFRRVPRELTLAEIAARIQDVDIIVTEGFKREAAPKILVSRAGLDTDYVVPPDELVAIVADHPGTPGVPHFDLDEVSPVATFLCEHFQIGPRR